MTIKEKARSMKLTAPALMASSEETRNRALSLMAEGLSAHRDEIFAANAKDMAGAETAGVAGAVLKRLKFDQDKLDSVTEGLRDLIRLPDPIGRIQIFREMDEGLVMKRVTCPIGVIGVIFEARPDAMIQIASLCIKSGNCAILKGGKETAETNRTIFGILHEAVVKAGLPRESLCQAETHSEIDELLDCYGFVDLLIPRGSNAFVKRIMENTRIPVMGHADGICHIYVDDAADFDKAFPVIIDAKTQYTAACNAVETLLVNRSVAKAFLPQMAGAFAKAGVEMRGTREVSAIIPLSQIMEEEDFRTEYLEKIISIKLVGDVNEAADHINRFGSHHTDAILTENDDHAKTFAQLVDSAGVYRNISTRFADGFRYGFGAEVGISTSKLHARGPVGLEGLMTYKYQISGDGHIVGDYAEGRRQFHFKDL